MKRELKRLGSDEFIEVYDFTEFKKLKFNKFEIELGNDELTEYFYNDEDNYDQLVEMEDYDRYGLISYKTFNLNELIDNSYTWENIEVFISKMNNPSELSDRVEIMLRNYLEGNVSGLCDGEFTLGVIQFSYFIDGVETEIEY
jgi:hypothetical protein